MSNEVITRFLNVTLRGFSMGSRFVLIFAMAKMFEPAELGLFGLMVATVSFSSLMIGADFYTYAHRELLAREPNDWSFVIQHQIKAQLLLYVILLPAQLAIFMFGLMDWQYAAWFFALLIVEHISQEINRLLTVMHEQIIASWILFVRLGSWVIFILPLMYLIPEYRNLNTLYLAWFMGSLSATLIGVIAIRKRLPNWQNYATNFTWVKKGLKVGGLFLFATICFKGLLTFDRYAIEAISSVDVLGVYVFYIGLVIGAYSVLEPAVFSFLYPKMLQNYQLGNKQRYQNIFKEMIISTVLLSVILGGLLWSITPYLIAWIEKPIYVEYLSDFSMLIAVGFALNIGYIPHYALYAMKADRWILAAHISSLVVFFVSLHMVRLEGGIATVAFALLCAVLWMAMIKTIGYFHTKKYSTLIQA